jgi:hypothetical protein
VKRPKLDIHSRSQWPSGALSNFTAHGFVFDGVPCGSMEGFLQSLKIRNPEAQRAVCALTGVVAKKAGQTVVPDWRESQTLWWKGQPVARQGEEYQRLISNAYDAMFADSPSFRFALIVTDRVKLTHLIGMQNPAQTVLTEHELWSQLVRLRQRMIRHLLPRTCS